MAVDPHQSDIPKTPRRDITKDDLRKPARNDRGIGTVWLMLGFLLVLFIGALYKSEPERTTMQTTQTSRDMPQTKDPVPPR